MRKAFKKTLQTFLIVFRRLTGFVFRHEVSVLCYHAVDDEDKWELTISPKKFKEQIEWLKKKKYYFCSTEDLVKHIEGSLTLPRKTVNITFDDGYSCVYHNAFPVLKEHEIPFTVFLLGDFDLSKENRGTKRHGLFSNEISELKVSGLATFGYHSKNHFMLDRLGSDDIIHEIKNDFDYKYFAYPGGHHSLESQKLVREIGYEAAFAITPGLVNRDDDLYLIKRNVILRSMSLSDLEFRVTKAIDWYRSIIKLFKK